MITKSGWLGKLKQDPVTTLDQTLYNNMYGPISVVRDWCKGGSAPSFLLDGALTEWGNSFWGVLPEDKALRRKVAAAWSGGLLLVKDLDLRLATRFLKDHHEDRVYLCDLSKSRDILGQYYEIMRADTGVTSPRYWIELATLREDVPLGHRETAIMALAELGDFNVVRDTFKEMEEELKKIAAVSGKATLKNINIFLKGLHSILSIKYPAFL